MKFVIQKNPDFFYKIRVLNVIKIFLILFITSACTVSDTQTELTSLTIAGSTAMLPLIHDLAHAYERATPHVSIEIRGGGSQFGITATRSEQIDIGMSSRPLRGDEEQDLRATAIAYDGIAVIVNAQNTLEDLSLVNLRAVFSGEEWDWAFVGGAGGEIAVVSREDGSGTRAVFEGQIMKSSDVTPRAIVMPHSVAVVDFVSQNRNAIGYVSMSYLSNSTAKVKALSLDSVALTAETIKSREYPLSRTLFLLTSSKPPREIESFIDFVLSEEGQAVVDKQYVSIK